MHLPTAHALRKTKRQRLEGGGGGRDSPVSAIRISDCNAARSRHSLVFLPSRAVSPVLIPSGGGEPPPSVWQSLAGSLCDAQDELNSVARGFSLSVKS